MPPLLIAQRQGLAKVVRVLVEVTARIRSLLVCGHASISNDSSTFVKAKANLNARDANQWSPALLAAHLGDLDMLEVCNLT